MTAHIPDGEYDLDFSALFSSCQSDIFGIRYGFKPDTIDQLSSSKFYIDDSEQHNEGAKEVPCYLVFNSKVNEKAITTDFNKDEQIYFEGRSRPNVTSCPSSAATANENSLMSEYTLCYDDVSKSFKVDTFNGFIKMNKSREPERISKSISKISKSVTSNLENNSRASITSYIDSLISNFTTNNYSTNATTSCNSTTTNTIARPINTPTTTNSSNLKSLKIPIKVINNLNIPIEKTKSTTSYGKLLTSISPIRKSGSPIQSPTIQPTTTPISTSTSPQLSRQSSPLVSTSIVSASKIPLTSKNLSQSSQSPSPVLKSTRSGSSNGGTGSRKLQKSLLLRKAERAVGINRGNISKPRLSSPASSSSVLSTQRRKNDQLLSNINKDVDKDSKEIRLKQIERERERQIKQARPEQTAFELNLTPPPTSRPSSRSVIKPISENTIKTGYKNTTKTILKPIINPITKPVTKSVTKPVVQPASDSYHKPVSSTISSSSSKSDFRNNKSFNTTPRAVSQPESNEVTSVKSIRKSPSPVISDDELAKFSNTDENAIISEDDGDKTINFKNATKKMEESNIENNDIDDEFQLDFSDWEDADVIGGPIISEDNETAGNSDFNLIIEDDPIKTKRENEKEMEKRRQQEREDTLEFKKELAIKERELRLQQQQYATKKKTKQTKLTGTASKTASTATNHKTNSNKGNVENATSTETEQDKAFDEAFDEAFGDFSEEEDISEEE